MKSGTLLFLTRVGLRLFRILFAELFLGQFDLLYLFGLDLFLHHFLLLYFFLFDNWPR